MEGGKEGRKKGMEGGREKGEKKKERKNKSPLKVKIYFSYFCISLRKISALISK
jgi:hypothetical protein